MDDDDAAGTKTAVTGKPISSGNTTSSGNTASSGNPATVKRSSLNAKRNSHSGEGDGVSLLMASKGPHWRKAKYKNMFVKNESATIMDSSLIGILHSLSAFIKF